MSMRPRGVLLGFVEGQAARVYGELSASARRAAVLDNFATYFGGFGLHPQDAFASLWAACAMNALGVLYAWIQLRLTRPADQH